MKALLILIILVLCTTFVSAEFSKKEMKDLQVTADLSGKLTINDLEITLKPNLSPTAPQIIYQIDDKAVEKTNLSCSVRYVPAILLDGKTDEVEFVIKNKMTGKIEKPKRTERIQYNYPWELKDRLGFENYEELRKYCEKNLDYCISELGHYYILGYDGYDMNLKKIDLVTERKYTTELTDDGFKIVGLDGLTHIIANDYVASGKQIWCDSNCDVGTELYPFLNSTMPECFYLNTSKDASNATSMEVICDIVVNESSNLHADHFNLIMNQWDNRGFGFIYQYNNSFVDMNNGTLGYNSIENTGWLFKLGADGVENATQEFDSMMLSGTHESISATPSGCLNATITNSLINEFGVSGRCTNSTGDIVAGQLNFTGTKLIGVSIGVPAEIFGDFSMYNPKINCFYIFQEGYTGEITFSNIETSKLVCETLFFIGGVGNEPLLTGIINLTNAIIETNDYSDTFSICNGVVFNPRCLAYDFRIKQNQFYDLNISGASGNVPMNTNCTSIPSSTFPNEEVNATDVIALDCDTIRLRWQKDFGAIDNGIERFYSATINLTHTNGTYLPLNMQIDNSILNRGQMFMIKYPTTLKFIQGGGTWIF